MLSFINRDNINILEPSAGYGVLADFIKNKFPNSTIDCIELNEQCCSALKNKGYNTKRINFLNFFTDKLYDAVIASPTFKNNIDIIHITKMYEHIKNDGILISLTSPKWLIENNGHQSKFRKWLEDKNYSLIMLPDFSFIENYETVPTAIIIIKK